MNPKTKNVKGKKCTICDFPFSDEHHLFPHHAKNAWLPRGKSGEQTISLCPNHHRCANIVQAVIERYVRGGEDFDGFAEWAEQFFAFDPNFRKLIPDLVNGYMSEESRLVDEMLGG